jgi:hypothetical protein
MVNWKKFFLFVGIPIISFYIFLIIIVFAFISGLFLWLLIIGVASLFYNKKEIWKSLSKLSLTFLFIIFLFYPNVTVLPSQIVNHIDRSRLFDPNEPLVQQLNSTEPGNMWDYLNQSSGGVITPAYFYQNMTDDDRLANMTEYIITWVIHYEEVMGHYFVLDYIPTVREAISEGRGDCKARTVTMVSFFLFMGYNQTYAVEDAFHTYTCVFLGPDKTDPHYYYTRGRTDYMIMFNADEIIYTKSLFQRLGYIFFSPRFSKEIKELFQNPITLFILPGIFIALGFLLPKIVGSQTDEKQTRKYLKNAFLSSILIVGGFFLALGIGNIMPQLILLIILIAIITAIHAIHLNLGVRLITHKSK